MSEKKPIYAEPKEVPLKVATMGTVTAYATRRIGQEWPTIGWHTDPTKVKLSPGFERVRIEISPA